MKFQFDVDCRFSVTLDAFDKEEARKTLIRDLKCGDMDEQFERYSVVSKGRKVK